MFGVPNHWVKLGQIYLFKISHTQHIWQDKISNMFQLKHVAYFTISYMLYMTHFEKNMYLQFKTKRGWAVSKYLS